MSQEFSPFSSALEIFNKQVTSTSASETEETPSEPITQESLSPEENADEAATPATESTSKDSEEDAVFVTDAQGRRKVKVDWNDRAKLKKYVEMAYGQRKIQSERDKLQKQLAELEPLGKKTKELEDSWNALESAYQTEGFKGLVNLIAGDQNGWEKLLESELSKRETWQKATPEQRRAMELEQELARERRERAEMKKAMEEGLKQTEANKATAEEEYLKSRVVPAFNKYRFDGKLGDTKMESRIDRAIWDEVMEELGEISSSTEITPQLADKKFRETAAQYQRMFKAQADIKSKQTLEQKKSKAAETAATIAKSKMQPTQGSIGDEAMAQIRSGDLVSAFKSIFKG